MHKPEWFTPTLSTPIFKAASEFYDFAAELGQVAEDRGKASFDEELTELRIGPWIRWTPVRGLEGYPGTLAESLSKDVGLFAVWELFKSSKKLKEMGEVQVCTVCGDSIRLQTHTLGLKLVQSLCGLHLIGLPAKASEAASKAAALFSWDNSGDKAAYATLAQLRYWGLIESGTETHTWVVTLKGKSFLSGKIKVFKKVLTFREKRLRFTGSEVHISKVIPDWTSRQKSIFQAHGAMKDIVEGV